MLEAKGLDHFMDVCAEIHDSQASDAQQEALTIRDQRSAVRGARTVKHPTVKTTPDFFNRISQKRSVGG
jgi:hypothetical protein